MATRRDAQLNDMIRLKQPLPAPVERWQVVPTRRCAGPVPVKERIPRQHSPLKQIPSNIQSSKTPECGRLSMKTKTPSSRVKSKTPGTRTNSRTPGNQYTPGKNAFTPSSGCRFIPNRAAMDVGYSSFLVNQRERPEEQTGREREEEEEGSEGASSPVHTENYRQGLITALSRSRGHQKSVLSFKPSTPSASSSYLAESFSEARDASVCASQPKATPKSTVLTPTKVMDLPTLTDDYYLNTLDWGRNNLLAIGLGASVYIWDAGSDTSQALLELKEEGHYITSVSWSGNGKYLAVGDSSATIQLWDIQQEKKLRTMTGGHSSRVGVLAWTKHTVASGDAKGLILHNDVRKRDPVIGTSRHHQMEVCGLQWSPDGSKLASGANDNLVCIWRARSPEEPAQVLTGHQAAVKAVAWCPWKPSVLATGGGSSDKTIKFWNLYTGQCTDTINTKSQVSSLAWNKYHHQLISAHGHPKNRMVVWNYPTMTPLKVLTGHSNRIIHMTLSPRRSRVASASSDETLRIWRCFERINHDVSQRSYSEESISALLQSLG